MSFVPTFNPRSSTVDFKLYSCKILIKIKMTEPNSFFEWSFDGPYLKMIITEELSDWLELMTIGYYNFDVIDKVRMDKDGNHSTDIFFMMTFEKKKDAALFKLVWTP